MYLNVLHECLARATNRNHLSGVDVECMAQSLRVRLYIEQY